jgi:hypothetical protein
VKTASISSDAGGNLNLVPGAGALLSLTDGALNGALTVTPSGTAPYVQIANFLTMGNGTALAGLGTPPNGAIRYCSDCKNVGDAVTAGAVCVGAGTGALAFRENNAWRCH